MSLLTISFISILNHLTIITVNKDKSNVMWFNVRSRKSIETPPVLLDSCSLEEVASQKYLGVVFDSDLHWSLTVTFIGLLMFRLFAGKWHNIYT